MLLFLHFFSNEGADVWFNAENYSLNVQSVNLSSSSNVVILFKGTILASDWVVIIYLTISTGSGI